MLRSLFLAILVTFSFQGLSQANNKVDLRLFEEELKVKITTSYGDIIVELYPQKAPVTVKNFLKYIDKGYYSKTIFHRVMKDFMIQGGGYATNYQLKPTLAPIKNESDNGLKNTIGTIAMARTRDPHSATSQFFINSADNTHLDMVGDTWGYSVFGKVVDGMTVVKEINNAPTGPAGPFDIDAPQGLIVIESISILAKKPAATTKTKPKTEQNAKKASE